MNLQQEGFADTCKLIEAQFQEQISAHDVRLVDQAKHFDDVCSLLERKFDDKNAMQDSRADESDEVAREQHGQLSGRAAEIERQLEAQSAAQTLRSDNLASHFQASLAKLDEAFKQAHVAADKRLDALADSTRVTAAGLAEETAQRRAGHPAVLGCQPLARAATGLRALADAQHRRRILHD